MSVMAPACTCASASWSRGWKASRSWRRWPKELPRSRSRARRRAASTTRCAASKAFPSRSKQPEAIMPSIHFVHPDKRSEPVAATIGDSVMQLATGHGIDGIVAECGGHAMCATCHVYVDEGWLPLLAAMSDEENELLDGVAAERRPNSRLSCQIKITPELDGLVVRLPDRQI